MGTEFSSTQAYGGHFSLRSPHCSKIKAIAIERKYRVWLTMVIAMVMPVGFYFCFVFDTKVSRSPGWPRSHYVAEDSIEL